MLPFIPLLEYWPKSHAQFLAPGAPSSRTVRIVAEALLNTNRILRKLKKENDKALWYHELSVPGAVIGHGTPSGLVPGSVSVLGVAQY